LDAPRAFQVTRIKIECCGDERFVKAHRVNPTNFLAELKRRSVYKTAIAYGVVAWLLIQVATQVFPFFEIPNWTVRLVVLLAVIGFPIALVIAWAFELTPEGLKRTEVADAAHEHSRGRTWIYVVVIGALISIGLFLTATRLEPAKRNWVSCRKNRSRCCHSKFEPKDRLFADGIRTKSSPQSERSAISR
jgi:hypothetical protein